MAFSQSNFEFQAKKPWFLGILHWLVFFSSILLVLIYGYSLSIKTLQNQKIEFNLLLDRFIQITDDRIKANEQVLRGVVGLFEASNEINRNEFKAYIEALNIKERYPGIQGIGFSKWIPSDQLTQFINAVRNEGFVDFQITPLGQRDSYTSILFLEPFDWRNQRAFGYDMFSEPMRQKAMARARDTELASLSNKVILLQETEQDVQAGLLLYLPIFKKSHIDQSQEFIGWAYSPLRMHDLLGNILSQKHTDFVDRIGVAVYDGNSAANESLLFTSQFSEISAANSIQETRQLQLAGQTWTIKAHSLPGFVKSGASRESIILIGGVLFDILLTILVRTLVQSHIRMLKTALVLREFKAIVDYSADAIISKTLDGKIVSWNRGAEKVFGYKAEEVIGKSNSLLIPPRLIQQELEKRDIIAKGEVIEHFETVRLHRDGRLMDISATFSPILDGKGKVVGYANIVRDITQKKQAERQHRETEERLTLATIHNGVGIWDWNIETLEMVWDDSMFALYHLNPEDFSGGVDTWEKCLHPDDKERCNLEIEAALADKMPFDTEFRVLWPNGQTRYIKAVAKVFRDEHGQALRMLGTNIDITERKQLEIELQRQAHIDFLTGVNNRGYFMELAEMELNRAIRYQNPLSILMLDIDYFKLVNDNYGHHTGDQVLQKLAEICNRTLREVDIMGRLGGEEFALLLPETDNQEAFEVAQRLRIAVSNTDVIIDDYPALQLTISIGVSSLSQNCNDLDLLLDLADKALYKAKNTGRNKVCNSSD